jgi:hypothetical protein
MKNFILCCLLFIGGFTNAQTLQEYYFNNSLAGTGGGGNLSELISCTATPGAFGTDSIITSNGLCSVSTAFCFTAGGGFSYPNNSITGSYTINLFFKFSALTGYSRIIDFSNSVSDAGFYLLNNCLNFYPNGNVGTCPYFQPNVYYLFTFVRDGNTNVISVYVNGTLFSTYTDTGNIYKAATSTTPIIFFRDDNTVPCESKAGCIKYASVSQQLLTAQQVDSIWQNICSISLPPCSAAISYPGSPYSDALSTPQAVTLTGTAGGVFSAANGLSINSSTGAITPSASTPGTYTVSYAVADSGVCSGITATTTVTVLSSSFTCSPNGNTIIFSNYDGGVLNINVDVNIPNLKIGVVSYEPVQINLTGPYASNVTRVIRAGFPNTNNNNCNINLNSTSINGPTPGNYSIYDIPANTLSNPNGYASGIICAYSCNTTTNQGGCNTIDQVLSYFNSQLGGTVYSLNVQYCCWKAANTYQVSALSNSCCNSATPTAAISYAGTPFCQGVNTPQAVTLTGSTAGTFSAAPSGLTINATTGEVTPSTSTPNTYTVTYTVAGCPDFTTTATVQILTFPTATISYPATAFCTGMPPQAATITGTTGGTFSTTNGLSLDAQTGTINPAASTAGNYTVSYTLAGSGCAGFTTTTPVTISQTITAAIADSICPGQSYTFGNYVATVAGSYADTSSTAAGCDSITVLNLSITAAPNATITTNTSVFCPGDSALVCAPQNVGSYLWNTGATGSCITAVNAGNYYVTVTDANNCTAESNHLALSVYPLPPVSVSINGDTLSVLNASNVQWFLNSQPINNAQSSIYVAQVTGNYQVQITDSNGCTALSNIIQVTITGLNTQLNIEKLNVYPNPLENGLWTLECDRTMVGKTLEIMDASGRLVYKSEIAAAKSEINLQAAKGIYYLRINGLNGVVRKLVKL